MHVAVLGASGRTGRLLVEQALGHGHDVAVLVHAAPVSLEHPRLRTVQGDARDFDAVNRLVRGVTGVAIAVGSDGGNSGIHEATAANVVHAMAAHAASRLAVLSAAGTFARGDRNLSLAFRALIATTLRGVYDDLEKMERRVMASDLDWTIVRPVGLTDDPGSGHYRVSRDGSIPPKVSRVARADVAALMLKALETETYLRQAVVIAQ